MENLLVNDDLGGFLDDVEEVVEEADDKSLLDSFHRLGNVAEKLGKCIFQMGGDWKRGRGD